MAELYPKFDRPVAADFKSDGDLLLAELEKLDEIAESPGVTPLSQYMDSREIPDGFEGDYDDVKRLLGDRDDWYCASDGIKTVDRLKGAILARSHSVLPVVELVNEGLEDLANCLKVAESVDARFRLEFGS